MIDMLQAAKAAKFEISRLSTQEKNHALLAMADALLAQQEQIEIIPTLVIYQGGRVLGSVVAPESKAAIENFIEENLGK